MLFKYKLKYKMQFLKLFNVKNWRNWTDLICIFLSLCIFFSCRKITEVNIPSTSIVGPGVYTNDLTAAATLTGLYSKMMAGTATIDGSGSISILAGLSADEFQNYDVGNVRLSLIFSNSLVSSNVPFWNDLYLYIYSANAAIEGLSKSQGVSVAAKQQLIGEAKFIRAFCHFYLVNFFGDVPLIITTDYRSNSSAPRTSKEQIYKQIVTDLKDAQSLLSANYIDADALTTTFERIRPNKWASTALLARIYLYMGDWARAEEEATKVINESGTYNLVYDLDGVFLKNSSEAILQLQPVLPGYNTIDANYLILRNSPGPEQPLAISSFLHNAFEGGDNRANKWMKDTMFNGRTYYYAYKYKVGSYDISKPISEYLMVLRLAEQYLIRAEARAHEGKIQGNNSASSDVNEIRMRAGLSTITAVNLQAILSIIEHERQVELFSEWGHRWLDLKRTERVNQVMSLITPQKGGNWNTNWQLYPIPLSEMQADPNLKPQNSGY